ncbi:MAG TPA: heme lyase NrfEFG subunit NrfE [Porticoccaceae bacterium]|nr:heme lyase NrfEFG subunit NrfE [Porticoccaceae bacterium]
MIAELGHFTLILALCLALAQAVVPLFGAALNNRLWMTTARSTACGQFVFVAISFICLTLLFINDDFSVRYVADNSNSLLPIYYKISAVWAAHEGSLLLWVLILAGWTLAVALFSRTLPLDMVARVLGVLGLVSIGFYLFVLLTSNPFERLLPFSPPDGSDLNPLLQDVGLIIHPPILYMGYVGFSVAFAFALAALMSGRMDAAWARWTRPWTNAAWVFLTLGIALGSWWAYYELGWGGWWFWDPVENASFMPWLAGTALMHSLSVAEKRGLFRSWTLLLAILSFSLSLLGTFLVRSGVLTSVHAFASDPERGVFILIFLALVIGGSLLLFALRGSVVARSASFDWCSREAFLLGNNVLLIIAMAIILLGTLYPLVADMAGWGKISVGPPYFNLFFVPLALMLALLMAPGAVMRWKTNELSDLANKGLLMVIASLTLAALTLLIAPVGFKVMPWLALSTAYWVGLWTLNDWWQKSESGRGRWAGARRLRGSYYGMQCAHLGVAVAIIGVALTSYYSEEHDLRLGPGESTSIGAYRFAFHGVIDVAGPNYIARRGHIEVFREDKSLLDLHPEKRHYTVGGQVMTEADIDGGLFRDIYAALGEDLKTEGAWSLRIYVKPFVRWIWLGALLMSLGGILAMLDKRYRRLNRASVGAGRSTRGAVLGAD